MRCSTSTSDSPSGNRWFLLCKTAALVRWYWANGETGDVDTDTAETTLSARGVARSRAASYEPPTSFGRADLFKLMEGVRPVTDVQRGFFDQDERHNRPSRELFLAGDAALLKCRCVAIIGTRDVSELGAQRARRLGRELAEADVVVVSGLAKGVDTAALEAAIAAGGRVIAVIGTPLDKAYPAENKRLQEQIYREHLLVSPFAAGAHTFRSSFPQRNRVMAALSDATAIIEASDTSGTLHQAAECVRLGRWLFIAKSIVDDAKLTWPASFRREPMTRVLTSTADVLATLSARL